MLIKKVCHIIVAASVCLCSAHRPVMITDRTSTDTGCVVPALRYINGAAFIRAGLTGKNVKIGVVDVGFYGADKDPRLQRFFRTKAVMGIKDFVYPGKNSLFGRQTDMDWHGTHVWCFIGGKDSVNCRYGLATDAIFYLARTDDGAREYQKEQEYFREALAWLHANGVRLVNVSLGYAYGFDDPAENYIPENMNGKTTIITKAAQEAASRYNMIIVAAAGNNGDNPWQIVSAPADASNVIAVGATDEAGSKKGFSAEGPDFLPYLKPNISCLNDTGGTSFSAPVISGVIACMLQKNPSLSNKQIISIIERSGHLYPYGNNYEGYGVPDAERILKLMEDSTFNFNRNRLVKAMGNEVSLPADATAKDWILFHKKDSWVVLKQQRIKPGGDQVLIERPSSATRSRLIVDDKIKAAYHTDTTTERIMYTTVVTGKEVIEIRWP